jgi:hypothetical protein
MNVEKSKVTRISRQPSPVQNVIDQKQLENVDYFNCLASMITSDSRWTRDIQFRISMAKSTFKKKKKKKKTLFTSKLVLNFRKKLVKPYNWIIALCGAEN